MTGHSFAAHQPGCALCVCGEWDHHPVHGPNFDRPYLDLKSAFFGPTEGEKKRRLQGGKAHAWKPMCGDRVLAGQWSGVVAAQHGPFSWVVIDGINVPQTHATITLRPVENSDGE